MVEKKQNKQTINGKAFEYALLEEFREKISFRAEVSVLQNNSLHIAKKYFDSFSEKEQDSFRLYSSFAVNFLLDMEPKLVNALNAGDILSLELVADKDGQSGDVRDVLAIRKSQDWEIGVSAKNNHRAVKHSRLSHKLDFGEKWLGIPCSSSYFEAIKPVFQNLTLLRTESKATKKWESLGDYHTSVYEPVLNAFKDELLRLDKDNPGVVASRLIQYLIGNRDFYKIIKSKGQVEIQAYNLYGSLNHSFGKVKPKFKVDKLKLPSRVIEVSYKDSSKSTLIVTMTEGWQISFRIHVASSRIESSLKFDINLVSSPYSLFVNKLSVV